MCGWVIRLYIILQRYGYDGFIEMQHKDGKACMMKNGELFRVVQKNCWNVEERIKEMDETGSF